MIRLIFPAVPFFVFSNKANILDSALTNLFLSLSLLKSSSNYSCTESDSGLKKSNTPSVESLLLFSSTKNASVSLLISSNSSACDSLSYCFLLLKMPQFLYLFPQIAAPVILYLTMYRSRINRQFFFEFCRLTL